jgi:rhodanese-related sulfurtransferase
MHRKHLGALMLGSVLALSVLIFVFMQQPLAPTTTQYGEVTVAEAQALIDANVALVIVDVRTSEEYVSGHLENAILLPVSELADRLDELSTEDDLLIYCRTGNRSTTAMNILAANGFTQLFHMLGGITAWTAAGYPTVHE